MKRTWLIAIGAILAVVALAGYLYGHSWYYRRLHAPARKAWKDHAVAEIAQLTGEPARLTPALQSAQKAWAAETNYSDAWISDDGGRTPSPVNFILMTNSEWIAYASKCSKEDERIHDIFVGRGSDEKWYYSTYHFCIRMIALRTDPQPESLASFVDRYCLHEFDGRSDDALAHTWPVKRKRNQDSREVLVVSPRAIQR